MATDYSQSELSPEDKALVDKFDEEFAPGVTIVKRAQPSIGGKKVNVYVDGLLVTMGEDSLNRLIELGFYIVVARK